MKKVLIFPGAFNPPHLGHAGIIKNALNKFTFDELWIVPSGNRDDKKIETSYEDRRMFGNLFVEYLKSVVNIPVSLITFELDNPENKPTHEILQEIKSNPDIEFTQLIGIDGYLNLKDKIAESGEKMLITTRKGYEVPDDFVLREGDNMINGSDFEISSTMIRNMIKEHDISYKKYLPAKIAEYIENKNLYQN